MAVGNECPVPTVNGIIGAGILAGLNNPQIIIKAIGMIFRIVMNSDDRLHFARKFSSD